MSKSAITVVTAKRLSLTTSKTGAIRRVASNDCKGVALCSIGRNSTGTVGEIIN
jgi:hypothetical protein